MGTDKGGSPEVVQGQPADPWHRGCVPLLPPALGGGWLTSWVCPSPNEDSSKPDTVLGPRDVSAEQNLQERVYGSRGRRDGVSPGRVPADRDEARDAHPSASCLLGRRVSFRFENTSPLPHIPFPTKPLCQNQGGVPPPPPACREPPVREAVLTSQAGAQWAVSRTFPASFLIPAATASGPGVWLMSYGGGARLWTKWPPTPCLHLLWSH